MLAWFVANQLSLNINQTCYSVFGTKQRITTQFKLYISGKEIQNAKSCKYLGIFIDCDLKWQTHKLSTISSLNLPAYFIE